MKVRLMKGLIVPMILSMAGLFVTAAVALEIPKMTKEELKELLGSPDLIIIDVRSGRDWKASEFKIKGAVRQDPYDSENWALKHPKDGTIVLYCA